MCSKHLQRRVVSTLGARGFSCAVSGPGQWEANILRPLADPDACKKKPLVPRIGCQLCCLIFKTEIVRANLDDMIFAYDCRMQHA